MSSSSLDPDFETAMQIHRLINGPEADEVLRIQTNREVSDEDRLYIESLGLEIAPQQLSEYPKTSLPWQIPRHPAEEKPTVSSEHNFMAPILLPDLKKKCLNELVELSRKIIAENGPKTILSKPVVQHLSEVFPETEIDLYKTKMLTPMTIEEFGHRILAVTVPYAIYKRCNTDPPRNTSQIPVHGQRAITTPTDVLGGELRDQIRFFTRAVPQPSTSSFKAPSNAAGPSSAQPSTSSFKPPFTAASTSLAQPQLLTKVKVEPLTKPSSTTAVKLPIAKLNQKRSHPDEFFLQSLNCYVHLEANKDEWIVVNTLPDAHIMFNTIRNKYFRRVSSISSYAAKWSKSFNNLENFRITTGDRKRVILNQTVLAERPRADIVNVLFHALIHISCFVSSGAMGKQIGDHDVNFHEIQKFFNEHLDLNIGTHHSFLQQSEPAQGVFKCQGQHCCRKSFTGVYRSQGEQDPAFRLFEQLHKNTCGGALHRVYAAQRTIANVVEEISIAHLLYQEIQQPENTNQNVGVSKPRELVDITDDDTAAPKVVNLLPLIDLEDNEFNANKKRTRKIVEIIKGVDRNEFNKCLFCNSELDAYGGLRAHLNVCMGS